MKDPEKALEDIRELIIGRLGLLRLFLVKGEITDNGHFVDEAFQCLENERIFLNILLELME